MAPELLRRPSGSAESRLDLEMSTSGGDSGPEFSAGIATRLGIRERRGESCYKVKTVEFHSWLAFILLFT